MDDITIPMINGNLSDLDQGNDDQSYSIATEGSDVLARESLWVVHISQFSHIFLYSQTIWLSNCLPFFICFQLGLRLTTPDCRETYSS